MSNMTSILLKIKVEIVFEGSKQNCASHIQVIQFYILQFIQV